MRVHWLSNQFISSDGSAVEAAVQLYRQHVSANRDVTREFSCALHCTQWNMCTLCSQRHMQASTRLPGYRHVVSKPRFVLSLVWPLVGTEQNRMGQRVHETCSAGCGRQANLFLELVAYANIALHKN
jgi:hypothetical protein